MRVVFLYTEIAEYFIACCKELIKKGVEVHVVRYAVNKEAPFQFVIQKEIKVYERNIYNDIQLINLVETISPDKIICSGWIDKGYLNVCKTFRKKAITVLALDNHWKGSLKQKLASVLSKLYLKKRFLKCWVPGNKQYEYAIKLGFKKENILTGFYSCDFDLFNNKYKLNKEQKNENNPKRFIFVGRYYEFKGIKDLWEAFIKTQQQTPNDWELWCLGTGDIEPIKHSKIKHFGFVQPKDLLDYIANTSVFVLPSHFEPWGVVVHEYAAAGFPIICSDKVGAAEAFVQNNVNGFIFKSGNISDLQEQLQKIINLTNFELNQMGEKSVELAKNITPSSWAKKIIEK